jgi:hypothetical protein
MTIKGKIFISLGDNTIKPDYIDINLKNGHYNTILDLYNSQELLLNSDDYINKSNSKFSKIFRKFQTTFTSLKEKDFIVISSILLENLIGMSLDNVSRIKEEYINANQELLETLKRKLCSDNTASFKNFFVKNKYNEIYHINFSNINIHFNSDKPFDLYKIIKEVPATNDIPYMGIIQENKNIPMIKIYKNLPSSQVKEWSLRNKNFKNFKGLNLKIKNNEGLYRSINMSRLAPKIFIKLPYEYSKDTRYSDIISESKYISSKVEDILSQTFNRDIALKNIEIVSFSIKLSFLHSFDFEKVKGRFYKKYNGSSSRNKVKIEKTIGEGSSLRFQYNDFLYIIHNGEISIFGLKTKADIQLSLSGIQLLDLSDKDFHKKVVEKNNFQTDINAVDCQKPRRPSITASNGLLYKGKHYTCSGNDTYPFIGYTLKGTPCCFKKDTHLTGYSSKEININFKKAFRRPIITDKVLPEGKVGEIQFLKNYYRVYNPTGSLKDCIYWLNNIKDTDMLTDSLYRTLLNGEVYDNSKDISHYKKMFLSNKLPENEMIDILEKYFQIQITIYEVTLTRGNKSTVKTIKTKNSQYSKALFIYKNIFKEKIHYEPIIYRNPENKSIYKTFNLEQKIKYHPFQPYKFELKDITSQVVNDFNKTEYIITQHGIFPTVSIPPVWGIKMIFTSPTPFYNLSQQIQECKKLSIKMYYQVIEDGKTVALLGGCDKINGLIPVLPSKIDTNIPISPMIYKGLLFSNYVYNSFQDNTLSLTQYYRELFIRVKMICNDANLLKNIKTVLKNKTLDYISKWKTIYNFINTFTLPYIIFKKNIDIKKHYLLSQRNLCNNENSKIDPFCEDGRLVIEESIYKFFIDKMTTLVLNNIIDTKIPTTIERFHGFYVRNTEKVYITEADLALLKKLK